jgi:three-Cys-motif partner protein
MSRARLGVSTGSAAPGIDSARRASARRCGARQVGELIAGDDGLAVEEVGDWVGEKHRVLRTYLDLHGAVRKGYSTRRNAYIDVFCGPGRAKVRGTTRYVRGSPVVAWTSSVECGAPFSEVYIADEDDERLALCVERLQRLNAPVISIAGNAVAAAKSIVPRLDPLGLHAAFIDPYSLGELRLELLSELAKLRRMDMLVHVSAQDLFRNLEKNIAGEQRQFDAFAPGWQSHVPRDGTREDQRKAVFEYWKTLVDKLGMATSVRMEQIRNRQNRDLYWLLLIARHDLAQKFFAIVLDTKQQRGFDGF